MTPSGPEIGPTGFAAASGAAALVFLPAVSGDDLWVRGDDARHLHRVRRLRAGEVVVASDGSGSWRRCSIARIGDDGVLLDPQGPITAEPRLVPALAVAFAPAKADHASGVVHQLVELGVDRIAPVETRRSVVRWDGDRAERARERLGRVAREAAMQSQRAWIPQVEECVSIASLAGHPAVVVAARDGVPAHELPAPVGGEWLVVVGPEGGLEAREIDAIAPAARVSVAPHVLRAVTAPVAVAAALAGFRSGGRDLGPTSAPRSVGG